MPTGAHLLLLRWRLRLPGARSSCGCTILPCCWTESEVLTDRVLCTARIKDKQLVLFMSGACIQGCGPDHMSNGVAQSMVQWHGWGMCPMVWTRPHVQWYGPEHASHDMVQTMCAVMWPGACVSWQAVSGHRSDSAPADFSWLGEPLIQRCLWGNPGPPSQTESFLLECRGHTG